MKTDQRSIAVRKMWALAVIVLALAGTSLVRNETQDEGNPAKTLYVWSGDQARKAPDFLAVIDFDEDSPRYGKVIRTVPVPGPGSSGNEPHHCHLSADKNVLACGGLLALLRGQNSIFFFDVSEARRPRFLFSTSGTLSNITDDFLPLKEGGFLVTQMGDHAGGVPGRVAEFDRNLSLVGEWPPNPPAHDSTRTASRPARTST
jgi:selenium-binding protein 1